MSETLPELPALQDADLDALVADLAKLSRNHLLYFRIEVGRRLARSFYGDDMQRYRASRGVKDSAFTRFVAERGDALADLGLSDGLLRSSLLCWFVVQDLPREVVAGLVFSHVVELTRVQDAQTRAILARAAVDNGWSGEALANAVLAVRAGRFPDGDLELPGLQPVPAPPEPEEGERAPQAGRVVTRFERTADDLDQLAGQWDRVPIEKLTRLQRERVSEAVERLEGRLAALKKRLR